MKVAPDYITVD